MIMKKLFFSLVLCLLVSVTFAGENRRDTDTLQNLLREANTLKNRDFPVELFDCKVTMNIGGVSVVFASAACAAARQAALTAYSIYIKLTEGVLSLFSTDETGKTHERVALPSR